MVSGCYGGSETRILNRQFPKVQSLKVSDSQGCPPVVFWVLWWLKNLYIESQIADGSKSHTITDVPKWYISAVVAHKPVF